MKAKAPTAMTTKAAATTATTCTTLGRRGAEDCCRLFSVERTSCCAPHSVQNRAPSSSSCPHFMQYMAASDPFFARSLQQ